MTKKILKWLKKYFVMILLVLVFLTGVGLLLYPTVSNLWNSVHQSRAIEGYSTQVDDMDEETYAQMLADAEAYNASLVGASNPLILSDEEMEAYYALLDVTQTGIMGYVTIEKIKCSLPIYHGTDEGVLQVGTGHLPGTSLPVGGASTHSVICGHRGIPSAKLFTDLDQMEIGDTFEIHVLKETLTYEVDQILIIEPDDVSALAIEEGKDLFTLMTCTPYGINTQRLLVRGHRVPNAENSDIVTSDARVVRPIYVALCIAIPFMLVVLAVSYLLSRRSSRERKKKELLKEELLKDMYRNEDLDHGKK